jgi:hypothetical protein
MSARPRVPQVSVSDRPRTSRIDPASQAALERSGQDDAPTAAPAPAGHETHPTSPTVLVPTYQRPSPRQARIHELRQKAQDKLAYVEFTLPEFTPLTPNHRHPYQAHTAWEQPDHHTLVDWYPDGKPTTLILWDRDRPDGQVVTATSVETTIRAAYRDCERQLRLKRHDVAVLLRKLETLKLTIDVQHHLLAERDAQNADLTAECGKFNLKAMELQADINRLQAINTCSQCGDVVEGETVVCQSCYQTKAAPPPATGEHPLDATTLAILRAAYPILTQEGGYVPMLSEKDQFRFYRDAFKDLANPEPSARGLAWSAIYRAYTGRLEA